MVSGSRAGLTSIRSDHPCRPSRHFDGALRRDHLHPCSMPERPQAWSPSMSTRSCPASSTRSCPASTMDATIGQPSGHRMPRRIRPDTVPSTRHASRTGSDAGRERTNGTEGSRTSSIATTTKAARRDTPSPLLWGRRLRLGKPRLARRWHHCQRDRNHGSDRAAPWCRSTVQAAPRRTALLGSDGWSVERAARLHPLCT
jgi:hypothetical protein